MPTQAPEVPYPKALQQFPTIRQSLMATFDSCHLLAKFDLEYRKGWSGHPQARGQIFHRVAAKALTAMHDAKENSINPEDALAILRECLRQHDVDDRDVVTIPFSEIKQLRWVVVKWANENVFDIEHLAEIEERLEATIAYPTETGEAVERRITGQLDGLWIPEPDWAVVVDWKDTWAVPPENELSADGYFQQRWYALLIFVRYPAIQRVTLREVYVRKKDKVTEVAPVREATIFRTEMQELKDEIAAKVETFDRAVEHGTWPLPEPPEMPKLWTPAPGAHCNFCPRPTACPIFPDARVQGAITDEETAKRMAAEQIVAKAAAGQRDKALRAWAGNRGPIPVKHAKDPNRVLGYRTVKRTSRPKREELERALAEQGADLDPKSLYVEKSSERFEPHTSQEPKDEPVDADLMNVLERSLREREEKSD